MNNRLRKNRRFIILLSLSAFAWNSWATASDGVPLPEATQEEPNYPAEANGKVGAGAALGYAGGLGLAYRRHFSDGTGFQISGMFAGSSGSAFANLGFTRMYTLRTGKTLRPYIPIAASVFYSYGTRYCYDNTYSSAYCSSSDYGYLTPTSSYKTSSASLNLGTGFGLEFHTFSHFGIAIELLMTVKINLIGGVGIDWLYPVPAGAFVYYF